MKNLEKHTDEFGFIGHLDKNGFLNDYGDSTQRTFSVNLFYLLNSKNRDEFDLIKTKVESHLVLISVGGGEISRHWDLLKWPGRKGCMSRDNINAVICALTIAGSTKIWPLVWSIVKRFGFLWNTVDIAGNKKPWWIFPDFIGIRNVATIVRAAINQKKIYPLYFVLFFLDLGLLFQSIAIWIESRLDPVDGKYHTSNDLDLTVHTLVAIKLYPTPTSALARMIYRDRKPIVEFGYFGPLSAWCSYFRHNSAPKIYLCGEDLIKRI